MTKKIIFSSGGTGGHIFPALSLMKYFSNKGYDVLLITDIRGNNFLKNKSEISTYTISVDSPINKNIFKKTLSFIKIFFSILKSILILRKERPDLIFGFGGFVSFPISFASKFFNIPLIIYENNMILGRTNKYLLPSAQKILLGVKMTINYPEKYKNKICHVGNILNENILNYSRLEKKNNGKIFSILILGGSQGAQVFGKIIPESIKIVKERGYEIKINQQCVEGQKNSLIEFYNNNKIKNNIFHFNDNILNLISDSDFAISRCGASTIAELVHTLTPFIAVPYPYAMDNHQYLNAEYYKNKGCCWLLEENNFTTTNLSNLILEIIEDKNKLNNIRENMKKNDSKNVYDKIYQSIKEFI